MDQILVQDLEDHGVLEDLHTRFFIPKMADKPQNPIMDSLKLSQDLKRLPAISFTDVVVPEVLPPIQPPQSENLWATLFDSKPPMKTGVRSWDTFRPSHSNIISPSPHLSEQKTTIFAAARHHVRPLLSDVGTEVLYVEQEELLASLRLMVTGTSSIFYSWDPISESFVLRGIERGNRGIIVIVGKDEVITASFLSRFLAIGTLYRRLEIFTSILTGNSESGPTIHAFAHSLTSVLTLVRLMLSESLDAYGPDSPTLNACWLGCAAPEQILLAVAKLCHREGAVVPKKYPSLQNGTKLLSDIYRHCTSHFEGASPRIVTAIFAFMLTVTSRDYFQKICLSIGLGCLSAFAINLPDFSDENSWRVPRQEHPSFVSPELQKNLRNAQRSLRLLQASRPDKLTIISSGHKPSSVGWFWTREEIQAVWDGNQNAISMDAGETPVDSATSVPGPTYKPELAGLRVFDREPGSMAISPATHIHKFIASFPGTLPALTPTFDDLTSLVLSPLAGHAATLSAALLDIFIAPSIPGLAVDLNLHSHLTLLRSFLLLSSHRFKSKLTGALFSDSDQYLWGNQSRDARSLALISRPPTNSESEKPWPVGLALGLIERESWPPGGADLSFYLRTVIVDSTVVQRHDRWEDDPQPHTPTAFEDADSRLGFAIRDLPTGKGRDRWLDPCSIEALDFLYMEYHPPGPLRILISPDIMSKYQRVFAFNLRLIRVESVVRVLYRFARSRREPLFPTFAPTNALFLHFRFLVYTFITQFSSYVYDTAIRGTFDAFLHVLETRDLQQFSDIFELADHHSNVMDDLLTACLLRSGQKPAGDALRGCLEKVLELGIFAGELARGKMQEYEAKERLEKMYDEFKAKMARFIQKLKVVTDKEVVVDSGNRTGQNRGIVSIQCLLVKLDSGWW